MTTVDMISEQAASSLTLSSQYVTFRVERILFGVEVEKVQEIIRSQPMTPVPLAPAIVRGLVNLRGQIITAIDMRSLLRLPPQETGAAPMNVVIRVNGEVVSLLVDAIGDVIDVDPGAFESTPETVATHIAQITQGVFKLERQLMLILDISSYIDRGAR